MKRAIIDALKTEQLKAVPMIGRTLRLPPDIDKEINDFCREEGLNRSTLYRRIFLEGWKALNGKGAK